MNHGNQRRFPAASAQERGIALLLVMIVVGMVMLLVMVFMSEASTGALIGQNIQQQAKARHIGESGLIMAVQKIKIAVDWRFTQPNGIWVDRFDYGGGSFSVWCQDGEDVNGDNVIDPAEGDGDLKDDVTDPVTLTAVGIFGGVTHKVRAVIHSDFDKKVLLVVKDPKNPKAEDLARMDLLPKWGWEVFLIKDSDSESKVATAVSEVNVVYLPAHVSLGGGMEKVLEVTEKGVVTEHHKAPKELKFGNDEGKEYPGSIIHINQLTDTVEQIVGVPSIENYTHYITRPFPAGILTVTDISQSLLEHKIDSDPDKVSTVTLAGLVTDPSKPTMLALDSGGVFKGKPAPGRRVAMPWGEDDENKFAFANLNDNGRLLLKRSLDWAGNTWVGPLPGVAVFDKVEVKNSAYIDSYDSTLGAYGGANQGNDVTVSTNQIKKDDKIKVEDNAQIRGTVHLQPDADPDKLIKLGGSGLILNEVGRIDTGVPIPRPAEPTILNDLGDQDLVTGTLYVNDDTMFKHLKLSGDAKVVLAPGVTVLATDEVSLKDNAEIVVGTPTIGFGTPGEIPTGSQFAGFSGKQASDRVEMPVDGTLTQIAPWVQGSPGKRIRVAVYTDKGGEPDTLITQSDVSGFTSSNWHWHFVNIPPTKLKKGKYWLALASDGGLKFLRNSNPATGEFRRINHNAVDGNFKPVWGSGSFTQDRHTWFLATYTPEDASAAYVNFFAKKEVKLEDSAAVNTVTTDPKTLTFHMIDKKVELKDASRMHAVVMGRESELNVDDNAEFFGQFIGRKLKVEKNGAFHADNSLAGGQDTLGGGFAQGTGVIYTVRWVENP